MLKLLLDKHVRQFYWTMCRLFGIETTKGKKQKWTPVSKQTLSVLQDWCEIELEKWKKENIDSSKTKLLFNKINEQSASIFIVDIENATATLRPKKADLIIDPGWAWRPAKYRDLIQAAVDRSNWPISCSLAIDVADLPDSSFDFPKFSFQKMTGSPNILLPDPDFFVFDWYLYSPDAIPTEKKKGAVFAGSSTGVLELTKSKIIDLEAERLKLAAALIGHPDIQFKITNAVQCDTAETEKFLRSQPYFSNEVINWADQLKWKFIISVDGNGACCSRVLQTLLSKSILLKSNSNSILYYFHGMKPFEHYIPFSHISELELIVKLEKAKCFDLRRMIRSANKFSGRFLSREAVIAYTGLLIESYADIFS
jgi:hypothetical protein